LVLEFNVGLSAVFVAALSGAMRMVTNVEIIVKI